MSDAKNEAEGEAEGEAEAVPLRLQAQGRGILFGTFVEQTLALTITH